MSTSPFMPEIEQRFTDNESDITTLQSTTAALKKTIVAMGQFSTLGGDTSETITGLTGVVATDSALVWIASDGTVTPNAVVTAACSTAEIGVTLSADPGTLVKLGYVVAR